MNSLVVLFAIFIAVGLFAALLQGRLSGSSGGVAYEARQELFSPAERSFLGVLEQAVAGNYRVMGKVRLGDLVQPPKGLSKSQRTGAWNRIHQKHVDFVLCRPDTLVVAGVVELDDASHRRKDRAERDDFIDRALGTAGIPVLRFPARKGYVVPEVRAKLDEVFSLRSEETAPAVSSGAAHGGQGASRASGNPAEVALASGAPLVNSPKYEQASGLVEKAGAQGEAGPVCPACKSLMVKRQAKKGPHAGKWFWACAEFPRCRKVVEIGG